MMNILKAAFLIKKHKKQIAEAVLVSSAVYTYLLFNGLTKGIRNDRQRNYTKNY